MKKLFLIFQLLVVMTIFTSCNDDYLTNADDVELTPVYWLYNTNSMSYVTSGVYSMYVYLEHPTMTEFTYIDDAGCITYDMADFVDNSTDEMWNFTFTRISVDGSCRKYEAYGYKDRTIYYDTENDNYHMLPLTLTTTKSDGTVEITESIEVLEHYRAISKM